MIIQPGISCSGVSFLPSDVYGLSFDVPDRAYAKVVDTKASLGDAKP